MDTCLKVQQRDQQVIARGSNQSSLVKTLLSVGKLFFWQWQAELNKLFLGQGCSLFSTNFAMSLTSWHQKTLNLFTKYSGQFNKTSFSCIVKLRNSNTTVFYSHSWQTDFTSWAVSGNSRALLTPWVCLRVLCRLCLTYTPCQLPGASQMCLLPWHSFPPCCKMRGAELKTNTWKSLCKDPWLPAAWFRLWFWFTLSGW